MLAVPWKVERQPTALLTGGHGHTYVVIRDGVRVAILGADQATLAAQIAQIPAMLEIVKEVAMATKREPLGGAVYIEARAILRAIKAPHA